jgi:hypothetical protein
MGLLAAKLRFYFNATIEGSNDIKKPVFEPAMEKILTYADGVGGGQFDRAFFDTRQTSGNDDLDLAGGLTDAFGAAITFAEIVGLIIIAKSTNPANLLVGGGTNPWVAPWGASGDIIKVPPNGMLALFSHDASGLGAVVAGTGDILRIAAASGTVDYDIGIIGRSA